ncbi:hypothetical protein V8D89_013695 [Ganoderma adspersum]
MLMLVLVLVCAPPLSCFVYVLGLVFLVTALVGFRSAPRSASVYAVLGLVCSYLHTSFASLLAVS